MFFWSFFFLFFAALQSTVFFLKSLDAAYALLLLSLVFFISRAIKHSTTSRIIMIKGIKRERERERERQRAKFILMTIVMSTIFRESEARQLINERSTFGELESYLFISLSLSLSAVAAAAAAPRKSNISIKSLLNTGERQIVILF